VLTVIREGGLFVWGICVKGIEDWELGIRGGAAQIHGRRFLIWPLAGMVDWENCSRKCREILHKSSELRDFHWYVTHGNFELVVILTICSPLHRLWRSFPRWGTPDFSGGIILANMVQFPLTVFGGAPPG